MFNKNKNTNSTLGELVKNARKDKGLSARKLAELCDISHTEINNIESGLRTKPSILVLKCFEKHLELPFSKTAKLAGYSDETIKYGEEDIIVSYEMYDKKIENYRLEQEHMLHFIDIKRHLGMDIKDYFKDIHDYLKKQNNIDNDLLKKADNIETLLSNLEDKYNFFFKDK